MTGVLEVQLDEPGMTILHRAGCAGLAATLEAANGDPGKEAEKLRKRGRWTISPRGVRLEWSGPDDDFFAALFAYAYPITPSGLMSLAVFGDPYQHRAEVLAFHRGMLESFLQHPSSRNTAKARRFEVLDVEGVQVAVDFLPVVDHNFRSTPFSLTKPHPVVGWLLPGAAVRHSAYQDPTSLVEPPSRALALRFGPVGCGFFLVDQWRQDGVHVYESAVVVPDVTDLPRFVLHLRTTYGARTEELYTAGPAEATLRFLILRAADDHERLVGVARCQVIAFTKRPWMDQQRVRDFVLTTDHVGPDLLRTYKRVRRCLRPRPRSLANGKARIDVPQVAELAADNLLHGRPWWRGFAAFISDPRVRTHVDKSERDGLKKMIHDPSTTDDVRAFVTACHEAWRNRLGQLSARAHSEGADFTSLAAGERDRLRATLARCKTRADFSACITDLWARGGPIPSLQQSWADVLPFLGARWREGRDLALLALASYSGQSNPAPASRVPLGSPAGSAQVSDRRDDTTSTTTG